MMTRQHGAWCADLWRMRRKSGKLTYKKAVGALGKRLRILLRNLHCKVKLKGQLKIFPFPLKIHDEA
ncbi:hypothetical protein A2U01_0070394 [Trifolium medium]|uniref:Uncharacterized protein n=1 Tax=Trifolium medium TaxID=97028 RepID=A0A392SJV4_9FABA|nr:hypothetical protein [Trifolium medium]